MKIVKVLLLLLSLISFSLHAQHIEWAKKFNGPGVQSILSIDIDSNGNVYLMGITDSETTDLDPGPGVFNLSHDQVDYWLSEFYDIFLVKLDIDGNFLWGKGLYSNFDADNRSLTMKIGPDGFIYTSYLMYEPQYYYTSTVIKKFDTSGNLVLTKSLNNHLDNQGFINTQNFDVDINGNIFINGNFLHEIVLDPQNPQFNFNYDGYGSFILKLNNSGDIQWTKIFTQNEGLHDYGKIMVRPDGDLIFLLGTLINNETQTGFYPVQTLYKINSANANIIWDKLFLKQYPNDFTLAQNGEIIISSDFSNDAIDVDPSTNMHILTPNNTYENQYILSLSAEGEFTHVIPYYFESNDFTSRRIDVDENYNYYLNITLYEYDGSFDVDPSEAEFIVSGSYAEIRSAVIKFDSSYAFETAYTFGELGDFLINQTKNFQDNLYFSGAYGFTTDILPGPEEYLLEQEEFGVRYDGYVFVLADCPLSKPNGNPEQYFCLEQNATISHLKPIASNIAWYESSTSTIPLEPTTPLTDEQTYYAARITNCGIPERLAVTAHINPSPVAPTVLNQQFCKSVNPTIANLIATGTDIKWYSDNTSTTPLSTTTALSNGQYYASQTINVCESPRMAITVTIQSTASPTAAASQSFCADINPTIANLAITGTDIKIYNAASGGNLLVTTTPLVDDQIYYATQILNGCESELRTAITVTINNTPPPTANTTQVFCAGDSPTLSNVIITGTSIKWYDAATNGNLLTASNLLTTTTYYASQTINGCESTLRTAINVTIDTANINAEDYEIYYCDENNNGNEIVDITKYTGNLVTNPSNYNFSYYLSAIAAENKNTDQLVNNPGNLQIGTGTTIVFARIESPGGCFKVVELKMQLAPLTPNILSDSDYYICQGNSIIINPNSGFSNFKWSNGATTNTLSIYKPGNYSVTAAYDHTVISCSTSFNFTVHELPLTQITKILTADWTNNQNTITILTAPGNNNEYSIDGNNYQSSNYFSHLQPGIYKVHARDINGCGHDTEEIVLLNYPKFFTPNNDGKNDYWKIDFSFFEDNLEAVIYDRYGKIIKGLKNNDQGWDGTLNQKLMPATDYWFVVKRNNGKEYKGHFSLIR